MVVLALTALLLLPATAWAGEPSLETNGVPTDQPSRVTISGEGFEPGMQVSLLLRSRQGQAYVSIDAEFLSPTRLAFEFPALQNPGEYDVQLSWPDGQQACTEQRLDVQLTHCSMQPIYFPVVGDWRLDDDARAAIRANAACMVAGGVESLHLMGFADDQGELIYNRDLSLLRAREVQRETEQAIPSWYPRVNMTLHALGEQAPAAQGEDDEARRKNRRVELRDLRSSSWRRASCSPIMVEFEPGTSKIDRKTQARIDERWTCYDVLKVDKILIYASPDRPESQDTFTTPRLDRDTEGSGELEAWELAEARATAVQRALPTHRWNIHPVAWLPDSTSPEADGQYGRATLLELYASESPEPSYDSFAIGGCLAKPKEPEEAPAVTEQWMGTLPLLPEEQSPWFFAVHGGAGPFASRDRDGTWGPLGWLDLRLGKTRGFFGAVGVESAPDRWGSGELSLDPYAIVGVASPLGIPTPHHAWVGVGSLGQTLSIGSDASLGSAFRQRVDFGLSLRGAVGLWSDAPWHAGVGLTASWRTSLHKRK